MVRDLAWRFLDTGRRVERALQILSLLGATLSAERDGPTDSLVLESVLTAAESIITYRRRYQSRARPDTVLDLLVGATDNPRSVRFQLELLVEHLEEIERASGGASSVARELVRDARSSVARVSSAQLTTASAGGERAELIGFTVTLREVLHRLADAVARENFGQQLPHRSVLTPTDTSSRLFATPDDEAAR